ncbi:hypothetical protein FHT80_005047 [Rhizobium sp. BK226]|nr:hypothetical protein [Rhizobium sp. BK591]MBB4115678.1 hypothetical protein [Rhizobium sp. BK226]MBB4217534.1 hypothetical protein [Rhizobium sp. BK212]
MTRIDENIRGLRHDCRWDAQQTEIIVFQQFAATVARQAGLIDRSRVDPDIEGFNVVRATDFQELKISRNLMQIDLYQNFEERSRRVIAAIDDGNSLMMPSSRCKQPAASGKIGIIRDTP